MTQVNDPIRNALDEDDAAFLKSLDDEPGLMTQFAGSFQGSMRFWMGMVFAMTFVLMAAAIYSGYQLWYAESARMMAVWGLGVWFCLHGIGMLKMWMWMRMNHLATLREIKRLELQVARLGAV